MKLLAFVLLGLMGVMFLLITLQELKKCNISFISKICYHLNNSKLFLIIFIIMIILMFLIINTIYHA